MSNTKVCNQAGIRYADTKDDELGLSLPWEYSWLYLKSGETGYKTIYTYRGIKDIFALINHWNRNPDWKYWI